MGLLCRWACYVPILLTEMDLDKESTNLATREHSTALFIALNERYNLIICEECEIELPSDWVVTYLKEYHRVRTTMEEVLILLGVGDYAMTLAEVENWNQNMWVGAAVQNISGVKGFRCNECQYSTSMKRVMKNYFFKEHKGLKWAENREECKVQLVFKQSLQEYIQVKDDNEMEVESEKNVGWNRAIEREFRESMANVRISGLNGMEIYAWWMSSLPKQGEMYWWKGKISRSLWLLLRYLWSATIFNRLCSMEGDIFIRLVWHWIRVV